MAKYPPEFEAAIEQTLKHEGGFVDDPVDPGGATNWGVSLRFARSIGLLDADQDGWADLDVDHDGDIDAADIAKLTREQAVDVYFWHFWKTGDYDRYPPFAGAKAFDLAVNAGPRQAAKITQRALRACGQTLVDDGAVGPKTFAALETVSGRELLFAMRSEAAGFYRTLIAQRPKLSKYRRGWLNRAYS